MNIGEIVKDAIKYPLSDWKKILILGIIIVINGISGIAVSLGTKNVDIISLLVGVGFIIGFLVNGYMFRIVKSSLDGVMKLPEFNDWVNMGIDGAKVFIAFIVYSIPVILVILLVSSFETYQIIFRNIGLNLSDLLVNSLVSVIWPGILTLIGLSYNVSLFLPEGVILSIFGILYMIIIIPLFLVAISNMAYYEGEFSSAFRFREIFDEIASIGWSNIIKWYIMLVAIGLILFVIESVIAYSFSLMHLNAVEDTIVGIFLTLILIPYFYMIFARSVALYYMPD